MSQIDLQWFAAEDEGRTEDPTEYRLQKAREEGRVAKSQELNSAIVLLVCVVTLIITAPSILNQLLDACHYFFMHCTDSKVDNMAFAVAFVTFFLKIILPVSIVGIVAAVASNIIQNRGFLFTTKTIEPHFDRLVPRLGEYFRKTLFSTEGAFNLIKSIVKVILLSAVAWMLVKSDVPKLLELLKTDNIYGGVSLIAGMGAKILVVSAIILLAIAVLDYVMQRRQFIESLKMTKQEIKEEMKEMEGDPQVKNHLQSAERQMLSQNIPAAVKKSDVVITNPTHFAVALAYDRTVDPGPKVMAKGEDQVALTIKRLAAEDDVPIIENRPLARGLYTDTSVGDIIPEAYYAAIATIYAHIQNIGRTKK